MILISTLSLKSSQCSSAPRKQGSTIISTRRYALVCYNVAGVNNKRIFEPRRKHLQKQKVKSFMYKYVFIALAEYKMRARRKSKCTSKTTFFSFNMWGRFFRDSHIGS